MNLLKSLTFPATLSFAVALGASAALAEAPKDQLLSLVEFELPGYVPGVDAKSLTRHQLATIYSIMHSNRSGGDKRALIRSAIGGRYALRSLFSR